MESLFFRSDDIQLFLEEGFLDQIKRKDSSGPTDLDLFFFITLLLVAKRGSTMVILSFPSSG
jgi:hypothetical protein